MLKAAKVITGTEERALWLVAMRNLKMARSADAYVRGSTVKFYDWLEFSSGLNLVALPVAAPRPGSVEVEVRPIWMSDGAILNDGTLGDLPPWFVGWFLAEAPRS
jgi:hypothetical protein